MTETSPVLEGAKNEISLEFDTVLPAITLKTIRSSFLVLILCRVIVISPSSFLFLLHSQWTCHLHPYFKNWNTFTAIRLSSFETPRPCFSSNYLSSSDLLYSNEKMMPNDDGENISACQGNLTCIPAAAIAWSVTQTSKFYAALFC